MSLSTADSSLFCGEDGTLELLLLQVPAGEAVVGEREALLRGQARRSPTEAEVQDCRELLSQTKPGTLTVMSFHPGLAGCAKELAALARDRTVVGLEGIGVDDYNSTVIAGGGALRRHRKLSLSSEDVKWDVKRGDDFTVFLPPKGSSAVRWAVFNCHDYSHVDLVRLIQDCELELVVVVTFNAATRLFWQYAISDAHRFCCYVVVANVAELGGSGVFAPFRRLGRETNAQIAAGGEIFVSKGPAELTIRVDLEIGQLRKIRSDFATKGFDAIEGSRSGHVTPMVPSEHFMSTHDRVAGPRERLEVEERPMDWVRENFRVAVGQFTSLGNDAYVDTRYRIRNRPGCVAFKTWLERRLEELAHRYAEREERPGELDLLVLPEVFVPRTSIGRLQEFSNSHQTTIIAGVDYPDGGIEKNANDCAVIRPREEPIYYRKITRSQYDAKTHGHDRMPLLRGDRLIRFADAYGHAFGVLICYDYSHFDLMWTLNLARRTWPLEMIVVIAHNPFADLYRWCCLADAHRFYQFVVMCNVAEFGGSGVFAPMRTPGARQVLTEAGKGAESLLQADLPLGKLIRARETDDSSLHKNKFMRRPGVFQRRLKKERRPEADLEVLRRALADLANDLRVGPDGLVMAGEVAIGAVALIEREGPEIVLIRKAPRDGYEFSGNWALPGGVARSPRRGQALTMNEVHEALETSLADRMRAEAGWPGAVSDLQAMPDANPRLTHYTRQGERKQTLVIPYLAARTDEFKPASNDPSAIDARWWRVSTTAELLAPANCLIVAEYYWTGLSEEERLAWGVSVDRAVRYLGPSG